MDYSKTVSGKGIGLLRPSDKLACVKKNLGHDKLFQADSLTKRPCELKGDINRLDYSY
jgi:hypothetical protein